MNKILLTLLCFVFATTVSAQQSTYINSTFDINVGHPVYWYGDVTFGPNAVVYIEDGAMAVFYGKNMSIDPAAKFIALPGNNQLGTGVIIFRGSNPLYTNYPQQQTLNGGNAGGANPSLINIEIDNSAGLSLTGSTRIANEVKFTQGHIYLNGFNLQLGSTGTLANYNVNKHVVTNGTGVLTKEAVANGDSFVFPVSIAGLDYTPATVTNTAATRNISVLVANYSNSSAQESIFLKKGIDRTWQISSNVAGNASITLQHNTANNANGLSTNGNEYINTLAYVTQQSAAGVWSESCTGSDGGSPVSILTGTSFVIPASVNATAYFSKRTVACTDLSIAKTVNNASPTVGGNLTFTLTASNLGNIDATGVVVNDLLPAGYTFVSATASTGTYSATTGVWSIGNLANGANATLTIVASVNASGSYANTATITGNEKDGVLSNNTSTVTPTPGAILANLGITKTVNNSSPTTGDNVVFTLTATNVGPNNATGVNVVDLLSAGYTFVSATPSVGTYTASTGNWAIGNLANNATATLTITATVKATGPYANTATISGTELDPVPGNNSATVTPTPNPAQVDLTITKTANTAAKAIGDEFDYVLVVKNVGANTATEIIASDILPTGVAYVSANTTYGTVNYSAVSKTVTWAIGSLAVGGEVRLTIRVKAESKGTIINTAIVTSQGREMTAANNTSAIAKEIFGIEVANVITPNGDGLNDTFTIKGLSEYPENSLAIFNRWGNEVWASRGATYNNEWAGNGLTEGTYFYKLTIKDKNGSFQTLLGSITLLRD